MNNQSITSNITYSNIDNNNYENLNNNFGKLRVGVMENSFPFSYCKKMFQPSENLIEEKKFRTEIGGIAVDIWKKIAEENNFDYEFICANSSYDQAVDDVEKGKYDIMLGDFSLTEKRLNQVLFTRSYYMGELRIFRKKRNEFISKLLTNRFLIILLLFFMLIILLFTFIYKFYKHTPLIQSFFSVYSVFFTSNLYLFPDSKNFWIRFINLTWSFIRFFFFAVIITQMINIIIQTSNRDISNEELENIKEVNVLGNTSFVHLIETLGKKPIENKTVDEILKKIKDSDGNVYWFHETLSAQDDAGNLNLAMTEQVLYNDEIAIIVNKKYPQIVEKFDRSLLQIQDSGYVLKICKLYLKYRYDACLL